MQVRLLGPVDVIADGVSRPVNGLRRKAVLTVLALDSGVIVSSDRLADVVCLGRRAARDVAEHIAAPRVVPAPGAGQP
jgi:hypothetical protein